MWNGNSTSLNCPQLARRKSKLRSLFCPIKGEAKTTQSLNAQVGRRLPVQDCIDDVRRKKGAPQDSAQILVVETESFRKHRSLRTFPGQNHRSPCISSCNRLQQRLDRLGRRGIRTNYEPHFAAEAFEPRFHCKGNQIIRAYFLAQQWRLQRSTGLALGDGRAKFAPARSHDQFVCLNDDAPDHLFHEVLHGGRRSRCQLRSQFLGTRDEQLRDLRLVLRKGEAIHHLVRRS